VSFSRFIHILLAPGGWGLLAQRANRPRRRILSKPPGPTIPPTRPARSRPARAGVRPGTQRSTAVSVRFC